MGIQDLNKTKNWGGCHHLLLLYDASKLSTEYVVKSPVLGLQRAPENSELAPSVLVLSDLTHSVESTESKVLEITNLMLKTYVYHSNNAILEPLDTNYIT